MKKHILSLLLCFVFANGFAQQQRKPSGYLLFQYNKTTHDQTRGNNPWGIGLGLQAFLNTRTKFTPMIEFTVDTYLDDDKVLRTNGDSVWPKTYQDVRSMSNLFIGYSFYPTKDFYLSFSGGPSFISGTTLFGIKPSLGIHFSKNKKWMAKLSYINIFEREKITKKNFGSYSFSIGYKLF